MLNNIVSYLMDSHKFVNTSCTLPDIVPTNYVRVRYLYCGICGGDYSRYLGYRDDYPISLGHEFVAQVLSINCESKLNYNVGDFVVSDFNFRCMECNYCKMGKTHLCIKNDMQFFTNRAFSLYADIHYSYLVKASIPHNYIYRATNIEPLSCVIHAMNHYDLSKINSILIYGTGNIGMLCAFYLSCCNNKNVYIYDKNEKKQKKFLSVFPCKKAEFDIPYDIVIEATNSSHGLLECINKCTYDQEICSFSHLYGQNTLHIYDTLVKKESHIYFPLRNGAQETLHKAAHLIENKWLKSYDNLIKIYETDDINSVFEYKHSCDVPKQVIKFIAY